LKSFFSIFFSLLFPVSVSWSGIKNKWHHLKKVIVLSFTVNL
jgi:hypothetical protein